MTVMTKTQLTGTNYAANANTGAIGSANHRHFVESVFGCYAHLRETTLSNPAVAVINAGASTWTELRTYTLATPSGSPFTAQSSETLTTDLTTGRITFPAAALGTYRIGYQLYLQPSASLFNGALPFTPPDMVAFDIRKDGSTALGGLSLGQFKAKPTVYLEVPTVPVSATTTGLFVGGFTESFTATGLTIMANALTDNTDYWDGIQVTNLTSSGSGSTELFATAKTTTVTGGTPLVANVARTFAFNHATTANMNIAAGDILKIVATKNTNAPNLQLVAIRGRLNENYGSENDLILMQGETEAIISTTGYVSIGGFCLSSTAGLLTVRGASFWADRIG